MACWCARKIALAIILSMFADEPISLISRPMISCTNGTLSRLSFFMIKKKPIEKKVTQARITIAPRHYQPMKLRLSGEVLIRPSLLLKMPTAMRPHRPQAACT